MNIDEMAEYFYKFPSTKDAYNNYNGELEFVGKGAGRIVFLHPNNKDKIIKFAVGTGINQNKTEAEIYKKSVRNNFSNYLVPVINKGANMKWITMPYVNIQGDSSDDKFAGPQAKRIHNLLDLNGISLYEIETTMYKGQARAYDYGVID